MHAVRAAVDVGPEVVVTPFVVVAPPPAAVVDELVEVDFEQPTATTAIEIMSANDSLAGFVQWAISFPLLSARKGRVVGERRCSSRAPAGKISEV
jgi:hypothetical protein